jgi:hypothetical protein
MEELVKSISDFCLLLLPIFLTLLVPVVVALARYLTAKLTNKLDAQTKLTVHEMVDRVILHGVAYAEQEAFKYAKTVSEKMDSGHKLELAINYVASQLNANDLPKLLAKDIESKIEACLGTGTLNTNGGIDESLAFDE